VTYKLEAPYAFARDPSIRERLTRQVLADVATTRGPPEAVAKPTSWRGSRRREKIALRRKFEERFDSDQQATYDDRRWGKSRIKPGRPRSARITARARGTPRR